MAPSSNWVRKLDSQSRNTSSILVGVTKPQIELPYKNLIDLQKISSRGCLSRCQSMVGRVLRRHGMKVRFFPSRPFFYGGVAQLVRASALQAEGLGFESRHPHHIASIV